MSDDSTTDDQDELQVNIVIEEAFRVSNDEAISQAEEGQAVQCLAESFESYVQNYQETWQQAWQHSIASFEREVQVWQDTIEGKLTSTKKNTPKAKPKPSKSGT